MFVNRCKLVINMEKYKEFIGLIKSYEEKQRNYGLLKSYLIEVENAQGHFWHETLWQDKASWDAFRKQDAHKEMHGKLEPILLQPVNMNFGNIILSS